MRQSNSAKNMSYAGIATALATISIILGGLVPVAFSVMPRIICPLCFWILVKRSNWWMGWFSVVATSLLVLALLGLNLLVIVEYVLYIVPHCVSLVLMHRLKYNLSTGWLRFGIVLVLGVVSTTVAVVFFFELLEYNTISYVTGTTIYVVVYAYNMFTFVALDWILLRFMFVLAPKILKQDKLYNTSRHVASHENDIFE